MTANIKVPGAGERTGYSRVDYYATRISIAVRTRFGAKSKAPASIGDGVKLIAERVQSYEDGSLSSKNKAKVAGKILVGSAVVTVVGMAGLDQLAPIGNGVSSLYDGILAGIWAIPRLGPLLGVGGNVAYFGYKGVKQTTRFSDIVDTVIKTAELATDNEKQAHEYLEGCAAALSILSPSDKILLTDIIAKKSDKLAVILRTKLSLPEVVTETPTEFVITPIQVKRDAQLAGIQEELGKAIKSAEPKAVVPAKPAALPKLSDTDQKIRNLEEAARSRDEKISALQAENVQLAQRGTASLEIMRKELEAAVAQKQSQIDEMKTQLNSMTGEGSQMAAKVAQMSEEITGLRAGKENMAAQIAQLTAANAGLNESLKSMRENFDKKGKAEIARLEKEISTIKSQMAAEMTKKDNEITQLKAEKEQMAAQAAALKQEKDGLAKEVGSLRGQVSALSQLADSGGEETKSLKSELVALRAKEQQLMFQIQEIYTNRTDVEKQAAEKLTQLQGKIDALTQEAVNKDNKMTELRAERSKLSDETAQMVAQFREKMEALAQKAREEIAKRDEQIRKLSEDLSKEASAKIRQLEAEKEELAAKLNDMEANYKARVSALQAQLAASEITVQSPISLQNAAAASIEGVEEYDKILGQLNKLTDSLEELKGTGQPTMGLAGVQRQLSYVIQVLVSMFTRMRGTYVEHQKMIAELKKFKELMSRVAPSVAQVHSDIQEFRKGE